MHPASIFIVDDHPLVRHGLRQLIEGEPDLCVYGDADSVSTAMQSISSSLPDLAIIDLSLPDGNGLKLVKHLLTRYPELSILISSMHDEMLFAERALKAGAKGYINKSATGDEIIDAIHQVLNGKTYLSTQAAKNLTIQNAGNNQRSEKSGIKQLSNRELEVYEFIGRGLSTGDISRKLNLSIKTIESHRANIKKKLGLASSGELTRSAMQWSLGSH